MAKQLNVSLNVDANTGQAKQALLDLQNSLTQLQNNSTKLNLGLNPTEIKQASNAIIDLQAHLKAATNINTGGLDFSKLDASLKASKMSITDYGRQLLNLGPQGQQAFQQLTAAVAASEVPVKRVSALFGEFGTVIKNTIRWQASSSLIHGFMGAIQQSFRYAQDLNKSLTDIQIVTQASDDHMANFAEQANKAARALSTTTTAYTKASLIYYQQGLSDKEVKERTDVTVKMANITGQTAQQVSDQMTAIWNNFATGSENLEYYADVITALGAATASSSAEISTGLQKFAAVADTVGLSYENATAALATITATTRQSADTVGTGLRTLFSRLQSLSLGETLEDGVNLTKYSKALDKVGVKVLDASGSLRTMDDILADLGEKWQNLSNAQQTALAQTVGGVRQYTTVMALMNNFDFYQENLKIAKNSEGTVQKQQEIYEKSWEASQKRVKASAEAIYQSLIDDKFFIGLNNTISGFLDLINSVIDGLGGLKGVLLTIGTIATTVFKNNFARGLFTAKTFLKDFFTPSKVIMDRKNQALDDLVYLSASNNTASNITRQQSDFLQRQTRAQVWLAQNKDTLSTFDYTKQSMLNDMIARDIQGYNNLVTRAATMRDERGDFRSSLFGQAFDVIRGRQDYQDRARAEELIAKYGNIRNQNGEISLQQTGLASRGIIRTQDRQDFDALIEKGIMNRAGQISSSLSDWQTTDSGFMTKFAKDFDQGIGDMIMKSNWFNGQNENIIQNAYANSQALNNPNIAKQADALLSSHGVSQSLIEAYKQGQIKFSDLGEQQLQQNISQISSDYGLRRADVEQYVSMLREELQVTQDIEKARENVDAKLKQQAIDQENIKKQAQQERQITAVASAFLSLGMAISQVNGIMDQWRQVAETGEGAGKALTSTLITVAMAFSGLFSALKTMQTANILPNLLGGLGGPQLALIAAAILAVIALISVAAKAIDNSVETEAEKIKRVGEEVEKLKQWADQAKDAFDNLLSAQSSHNELLDQLKTLTAGTEEFYNVLTQANDAANTLISDYGLKFGEDWTYGQNNRIEFTDQGNEKMTQSAKGRTEAAAYVNGVMDQYNEILNDTSWENLSKSRWDIMKDLLGEQGFREFYDYAYNNQSAAGPIDSQINNILQKYGYADESALNQAIQSRQQHFYAVDLTSALQGYALNNNLDLSGIAGTGALDYFNSQINGKEFKERFEAELAEIGTTGKTIKEEFKEALGFEATGDLVNDEATMKNMIASARVMNKYGPDFARVLTETQQFAKDFGLDKYQELDYQQLTQYVQAIRDANFEEGSYQKIMTDKVLTEYDRMNKATAENIMRAQGKTDEEIAKLTSENAEAMVKQLFADNASLTKEGLNAALQTTSMIRSTQDQDSKLADTFWNAIFGEDGQHFDRQLNGVLSNINFGNQLQAAFDLKKYAKLAANDPELASTLSSLGDTYIDELGGKAGLLEQMWETEDFKDSLKSLQKQFKKTGKLGAQDILDIADSCDILSDALEFGEISAGALADVISAMGLDGTLSIQMISNALLEALGISNALEDSWANATKYFTNMDSSLDASGQQFADNMNKYSKDMFELLGEGNVGGERLYQEAAIVGNQHYADYMRDFFYNQEKINADNPQLRQKEYEKTFGEWDKVMQTTQQEGNMRAYWDYMINNANAETLFGRSRVAGKNGEENKTISQALQDIGFSTGKNGDIELDVGNKTTQDLIQQVADALNISEEEAGARVAELTSHSQSISTDLKKNDFKAAAASFGHNTTAGQYEWGTWASRGAGGSSTQEQHASIAGFESLSIAEQAAFLDSNKAIIETLAKEGDAYGKLYQEQMKKLDTQRKSIQADKEQGKSSQDIIANARAYVAENGNVAESVQQVTDAQTGQTEAILDAETAVANYTAQGLSQEEALEAATQDAADAGAQLGATYTDAMGNTVALTMDAGESIEDFRARVAAAEKDAEQQKLGQNIFKGFTQAMSELKTSSIDLPEVNITIKSNADEIQTEINGIKKDGDVSVNVTDGGTVASTQSRINSLKANTIQVPIEANTEGFEKQMKALVEKEYSVNVSVHAAADNEALGGYVVQSHAMGSANRNISPGLSLTAEEGPEIIWNKNDGYSYLVGGNGHPEFVMLRPGDRVFNANQTRQILNYDKPDSNYFNSILDPSNLDQRLFGSFAGGNDSAYGSYGPNSRYGGGGSGKNQKTKDYTPERYHVITRQIQDLTFWYEELKKARDNAYGTNILDHIDEEIKGTEELIKAQQALVDEAMHYREVDLQRMKDLGIKFELDENGNIRNWDALQEKYRKDAEAGDEAAKERWNAIQQYEESLDKWQEAYAEFTDLRLQMAELQLERITTKTELKIDFDERDMKLIEHFMKKIDDNIYDTARVLQLAGAELTKINDKIDSTRLGIEEIFENMVDSEGNKIADMTLERFLALSEAERDALDINGNFGKQLEEYSDNLLDYIEELEDLKTKGVDELADALNELNGDIERSMGLFDHYSSLLGMLKDITDLQGVKLSAEMKGTLRDISNIMFLNTQNNIDAERNNYERLTAEVADLRAKVAATQDETLKRQWQEQLEAAEDQLNDSENRMLELWQTGLDQAKQMFEDALNDAVETYESSIAGMYETTTELQKAWDQQKANDDFYVKDFEKYYQISKLQRSITRDLDAARKAGIKQSEGLKKLYDDLNKARENGVELSAYDLDIFAKRYEYEKALADLEDARNAKSIVRLQRDRNGNWGYVYTSNMDEDDLMQKQQAIDDKFYELQKATQERVKSLSDDMMSEITGVGSRLQELYSSGASQEVIDKYLEQEQEYLNKYKNGLETALRDAGMTEEEARERYGNAGFDILNEFQETLFSAITGGNEGLDDFFARIGIAIHDADNTMADAGSQYRSQMDAVNKWFNESGQDLATVIKGFASMIGDESGTNLVNTQAQIQNAKDTFTEILQAANDFENQFMAVYEPIIKRNEQFILQLNAALDALNRKEFVGGTLMPYIGSYIDPSSFDTGGFTGDWGAGGRLAVLHEKENVFNAEDTARLLSASQILRTIDLQTNIFSKGLGNISTPAVNDGLTSDFEQNVVINADFPNAVNHAEIEEAFNNLANKATQYANRKNK